MFCRRRVGLVTCSMDFGFLTSLWSVSKRMVHGLSSVPMKLGGWQTVGVTNLRTSMSSMRMRCNLSLSLNEMPCISGFLHYGTGMFLSEVSDPLYLVHRVRLRGWLKLKSYGLQYWRLKLRLEIPTCYSRYAAYFLNCLNIMLTWLFEVATARWCRNWKLCYLEFESTCVTLLIGCVDPRMHATGKAINRTLVLSSLLICARRLWNFLAQRKQQYATLPPLLSHALSGRRWGISCWSNISCCVLLTHTQVFF